MAKKDLSPLQDHAVPEDIGLSSNSDFENEIARYIPKGSTFLGKGIEAQAYLSPTGEVYRIVKPQEVREYDEPIQVDRGGLPQVLQDIGRKDVVGDKPGEFAVIEKLPFVKTFDQLKKDEPEKFGKGSFYPIEEEISKGLKAQGWYSEDIHEGNVGLHEGQWKIIDPGGLAKLQDGGKVPEDPTKQAKPGKKDKIDTKLEPGEVVASRQDVAAMQSLLTTGAAQGMGIGELAGAPAGGMPQIAKGPGGIQIAGALGQPPIGLAEGTFNKSDWPEHIFMKGPPTADVAKGHVRMYHGGTPYSGTGGRWVNPQPEYAAGYADKQGRTDAIVQYIDLPENSPHLQKAFDDSGTNQTAPYMSTELPEEIAKGLKPYIPPSEKLAKDPDGSKLDATQLGMSHLYLDSNLTTQIAKDPNSSPLGGEIGPDNRPVNASGSEDWSLPSSAVDVPSSPQGPSGQGHADAPWALPAPEKKRGRLAKAPSGDKFLGGLASAGIDMMIAKSGAPDEFHGLFSQALKGGLGLPQKGMGSRGGMGGGLLSGLLGGGSGGMADLLGVGGGGGAGGDNQQALLDAIKALTDAVEALTEMMQSQSKDTQPGIKPDGSFVPSLGKSAATMLAGAPSQGTTQKGDSSSDMQKTITDTLMRAAMQAAMAAI